MSKYKFRGAVVYKAVLEIPVIDRIPALVHSGTDGKDLVQTALAAAITSAMENINVRVGLKEDQIIDLAEMIIDESYEDVLSLEDVVLFLQQLVMGKMGTINDRMDIPTFFKFFEEYRENRHKTYKRIRYEQEVNHKAQGPQERASEDRKTMREELREGIKDHMNHLYKEPPKKK